MDNEQTIQALKEYFAQRDDVVMAFLFGSRAKGKSRAASDWDIGVYLKEEGPEREHEFWAAVERMLRSEVDLVILNRASAEIAWPIVREGEVLAIKDHDIYMREVLRLSEEADAWYSTAHEYYAIFQRSASLSEKDRVRLERIVGFLDDVVEEYASFRKLSQEAYLHDKQKKRNVEHWIEHLVTSAVDIAKIVWASERRPLPETYKEFVIALGSVPPFDRDDACRKIADWVSLRNFLAHEYLDYRWRRIQSFLNETEPLWRTLIDAAKKFLEETPSASA